jgi:WD40 repeat protein
MTRSTLPLLRISCAALLAAPAAAQVELYGSPSPSTFGVELTNGPFQSFGGNAYFKLQLTGPNPLGGVLFLALARASVPIGAWTLLLDPITLQQVNFPLAPGVTEQPLPMPNDPSVFGIPVDFQALLLNGTDLGATNGLEVRIQQHRTPLRAYFPGQDFSQGANAPGQFSTMDFSTWPPAFRATGDIGFNGNISENFSVAVAVSDRLDFAFLHGNGANNAFIRVFDIAADPTGANVAYTSLGDIPLTAGPDTTIGYRDLEISRDGHWLFATTGSSPLALHVFDLTSLPGTLPNAPAQTFTFGNQGSGSALIDLSPDGRLLALALGSTPSADVFLYDITAAAQPLAPRATLFVPGSSGFGSPCALDFSPNSRRLFVVTGGTCSFYDVTANPPTPLVSGATWTTTGIATLPWNGGALALRQGQLVGIAAEDGATGLYRLIDLSEPAGPTFGTVIDQFSTNPGGNISNHRLHALGNIVVAIDGSGATRDAQWIDVIDLDTPDPLTGYRSARVQIPSTGRLAPTGLSCIPREFELR